MQDAVLKLKRSFGGGAMQPALPPADDSPLLPPEAQRSESPGRNGGTEPPAAEPLPTWPSRGASSKRGPLAAAPMAPPLHALTAPLEV